MTVYFNWVRFQEREREKWREEPRRRAVSQARCPQRALPLSTSRENPGELLHPLHPSFCVTPTTATISIPNGSVSALAEKLQRREEQEEGEEPASERERVERSSRRKESSDCSTSERIEKPAHGVEPSSPHPRTGKSEHTFPPFIFALCSNPP
jgi:hypothetical protein